LVIHAKVPGNTIGGLLLIKAGDDPDFAAQTLERFLFFTGPVSTPHISALCPAYFERTAKNALSSSQKVGCTVENALLSSNHKGILAPRGYETH
jgi:hypothetical protein